MNKKRIFPFGYRMTEGQIDLNAEEAECPLPAKIDRKKVKKTE